MSTFEEEYAARQRPRRVKERREALAKPWPWKLYAYLGWLMDAAESECGIALVMLLLMSVAAIHAAAALLCVVLLVWVVTIGAGWVVCLLLGAGVALGIRLAVIALIANDRKYRE